MASVLSAQKKDKLLNKRFKKNERKELHKLAGESRIELLSESRPAKTRLQYNRTIPCTPRAFI